MQKIFNYNFFRLKKILRLLVIFFGTLAILYKPIKNNYFINLTESSPTGIYKRSKKNVYNIGNFICFNTKNNPKIIKENREKGIPFLKKIAAKRGDIIDIKNNKVYINGKYICEIVKKDKYGEKIEYANYRNYELKEKEYYVLGENPYSYDSRYFGTICEDDIICQVKLIMKF